jgi:hypothetical protein
MTWLLEYKWIILSISEYVAWVLTLGWKVCDLHPKIGKITTYFIGFWAAILGWVPHIVLGIYDSYQAGHMTTFLLVDMVLIVFGITFGKKINKALNQLATKLIGRMRNKRIEA